jgi:hypothetical protein
VTTVEIPAALFGRLLAAHLSLRTGAWADGPGRQCEAHRELYAAVRAGHTRLSATAAFLAAQYACRDDGDSTEFVFYDVCDLIPELALHRIWAEDEAETARLRAEWRAEQAAKSADLSVRKVSITPVMYSGRSVDHA